MEIEPGTKIDLFVGDDWISGTFVGHTEEFGQDWIVLDIGKPEFRKINAGFVSDIQAKPQAHVINFPENKPLKIRGNNEGTEQKANLVP